MARLHEAGIGAERVPLSGASGGSFAGDVSVPIMGVDRRFEAKCRADGFRELYKWIEGHHGLFLKADRRGGLVVLRLEDFRRLVLAADQGKGRI